jgi:hypothetical protein
MLSRISTHQQVWMGKGSISSLKKHNLSAVRMNKIENFSRIQEEREKFYLQIPQK